MGSCGLLAEQRLRGHTTGPMSKGTFFTNEEDVTKTWISEVGLRLMPNTTFYVGVLGTVNEDQVFKCPSDVQACFKSGVVKVLCIFS